LEPNGIKKQHIIEAALKRFSHFGINKTTMSEIAEDIAVSKANLYYYFPDKTTLVIEVIKHLIAEGMQAYNEILNQSMSVLEMLIRFLKIRRDFFEKHYLLHITLGFADSHLNMEELDALREYAETKELEILHKTFKKGIDTLELVAFDVKIISQMYFTILKGIAMVSISRISNKDIPDISVFSEIFEKQKIASTIFLNGLRHDLIKN
jgi:TetR/AcrR family transcriptional regulator